MTAAKYTGFLGIVQALASGYRSVEYWTSMGEVLIEMASDIASNVAAVGTPGTPGGSVLTVQGVAGGTAQPVSDGGGSLTVDGTVAVSGAVSVDDGGGSLTVDGSVAAGPAPCSTAADNFVNSSLTAVTLLAANANRKAFSIYNDSSAVLIVKFGSAASTTSFHIKVNPDSYFESGAGFVYTGIITGLWEALNGFALVGEYTV